GEWFQAPDKKVTFSGGMGYSADGRRFASIGEGDRLHVFDADSWAEAPEIQLQPGKRGVAVVLSPRGKNAPAGCENHLIQVAEVAKGGPAHRVQLPPLNLGFNDVQALAFSQDNKLLIAGRATTVYLIDLTADRKVTTLHDHPKEKRDALVIS